MEEESRPLRKVRWTRRPGFQTLGMRALYGSLFLFFRCRTEIPPELRDSGDPVVFVANHYNVFGPIAFVVSMPAVTRFWSAEEMLDLEQVSGQMYPGLRQMLSFLSEERVRWLCKKLGGFVVRVLRSLGAIPVSRTNPARMMATMRGSLAALEAGENLLIFPETGKPEYSLTSVTPFFPGFAMVGRLWHRKTGRPLRFIPCYIDEQHHEIRLGEAVIWNPEAEPNRETERISEETNRCIRRMAAENRGVEKEEGAPGPRRAMLFCNLIRLILLLALLPAARAADRGAMLAIYCISQGIGFLGRWAGQAFAASNRPAFLLSHALGQGTDLLAAAVLAGENPGLRPLVWMLAGSLLFSCAANLFAFRRFGRCAGTNYFDNGAVYPAMILCLAGLARISLPPLIHTLLLIAEGAILLFSAVFTAAFNGRIGKEGPAAVANQGAE